MNYSAPRLIPTLHASKSFVAIVLCATVLAGCGKTQPTCLDDSTIALVKQLIEESLEKEVKGASTDTALLDRVKKRIQIAVTTIRTSNKDEKIGKVTCDAALEITVANAGQITADPAFKSLQNTSRIPATLDTSGPAWKTDIQYTAQHTDDSKNLLVELSGQAPMVALLSILAKAGVMEPKAPPAAFPQDLLASGNAREAAVRLMHHIYGKQEAKSGCWMFTFEDIPHCMKIVQSDIKTFDNGKRLYVIANGEAIDDKGETIAAHATQGLVGAFIVGETNGKAALIAQSTNIQAGTMGAAPPEWTLTELGANNNWGWHGEYGDCHQGYCGNRMIFLANRAGTIEQVGDVTTGYDDTGACGDDDCPTKTSSLKSTVSVSGNPKNAAFFDLLVTVIGTSNGKVLESKVDATVRQREARLHCAGRLSTGRSGFLASCPNRRRCTRRCA